MSEQVKVQVDRKFRGVTILKATEGPRIKRDEFEQVKEKGYHFYAMRHGDNDWSLPLSIEKGVLVNYFGYLITDAPLTLDQEGYNGNSYTELTEEESYHILQLAQLPESESLI